MSIDERVRLWKRYADVRLAMNQNDADDRLWVEERAIREALMRFA